MAAIGGEIDVSNTPTTGNYSAFDLYPPNSTNNSLYGSNNSDQQHQLALMKQQLILQQQMSKSENNISAPAITSSNSYPTKKNFNQSSPEKPSLSQSPPSPADSGVVTDSKLDGINISQDLIHSIETSKSEEDFPSKSPTLTFGASPDLVDQSNLLNFSSDAPVMNSFGLSAPTTSISSEIGIGSSEYHDGNANNIPQSLAAIWSAPTTNNPLTSQATDSIDDMLLQQLQQQQQLANWSNPGLMNGFPTGGLTSPPPGLYNNAQMNLQQQQNTAAQIQVLQQQLALRRSQANMMRQANPFNRSTSHQPGYGGGVALNGHKLNNFSPSPKSGSYSSWSNGQASLSSGWPTPSARTPSLFNSLQHSANSANRMMNGSTAFRKQSLGGQIPSPPRLGRSMSTPAKYGNYGGLGSLDDNKFFKMDGQNGMMSFNDNPGNDNMGMMSIESQLIDILRSNEQQQHRAQNFPRSTGKWPDMGNDLLLEESYNQMPGMGAFMSDFPPQERFSRKVFVGGLPPDIDEEEITASFRHFGALVVDWPHKAESKSYFPPKGYAFLLFQDEMSVQTLISCCMKDGDKLYIRVSSPTIREKAVQIRPWNLADSDFVLDGSQPLDPRKTIFVGGVPRPLRAVELAMIMDRLYGGVCYAGIDVDPELKYPKGAGRVAFSNQQSYIAAISARFVQLQLGDIDKRVEVKPYVLDDQHCDECQGSRCGGKFAPFFCANVTCLQYYCETCWASIHARPGREFHKPLVKEGADRSPRSMPFRW